MWKRRRGEATQVCGRVLTGIELDGQQFACELAAGHDSPHEHDGPQVYARWRDKPGGGIHGDVFRTKPRASLA